jgi:copper chaperone CopZ
MVRSLVLFAASSLFTVALACPGGTCSEDCKKASTTAAASTTDIKTAPGTHATFTLTGMSCGSCSEKAKAAFLGVQGVNAVTVDHSTGKAEVAFDSAKTNVDALVKAVATNTKYGISADKK